MSYNSQSGKSYKKKVIIPKKIDYDLPHNIMTMILRWIECYNSSIKEHVKISMENDFEDRINDSKAPTGYMKLSNSGKRADNESFKIEADIWKWLALQDDKNVDYYSEKISKLMRYDKNHIINVYVNGNRKLNKMKEFDPNYNQVKKKDMKEKEDTKKEEKEEKEEMKKDTKKVIYGDAWDLL